MRLFALYERYYLWILGLVAVLGVGIAAFFLGYAKASPQSALALLSDWSAQSAQVLASGWEQTADTRPEHFLQPSRKPGSGVTIDTLPDNGDLILLTGFFDDDPGLRLIMRDGTEVASWRAAFSQLLPERVGKPGAPQTDWNVDLHGSFIDPDGSVVLNFEYQGAVKLTRCEQRVWALTERNHHTVEPAVGGGYWIAGRRIVNEADAPEFHPLSNPQRESGHIEDDMILRVDENGQVTQRKSVFAVLKDNGFEAILTANGTGTDNSQALQDNEVLHLNSIVELTPDLAPAFPEFRAGDLVLSIRDYNLVVVVDPSDWSVKWHSVGPWIRQHSAVFMPDGTIGVFNNNAYTYELIDNETSDLSAPRVSDILEVDPRSGESRVVYGNRPGQELWSVVRGTVQPLAGGGMMIGETHAGRAFQVDASGKTVWEYINRYDEGHVLELTGARVFPASYFTVKDWSCP